MKLLPWFFSNGSFIFISALIILLSGGCKRDVVSAEEDLYNESVGGGYTYYQNGAVLSGAPESPHGSFKLKFNSVAAAVLDSSLELPAGSTFPEGSVIVKEVYTGSSLSLLAIMKKANHKNSREGWMWAEFDPDGKSVYSISKKGEACYGCHGNAPSRDYTRTFDLH